MRFPDDQIRYPVCDPLRLHTLRDLDQLIRWVDHPEHLQIPPNLPRWYHVQGLQKTGHGHSLLLEIFSVVLRKSLHDQMRLHDQMLPLKDCPVNLDHYCHQLPPLDPCHRHCRHFLSHCLHE